MMLFKCQYSQISSKWRAEKTVLLLKGSEVLRLDMHCKQLNHIEIFTSWTFNLSIGEYHFSQKGPYYMDIIIGSLLEKFFTLWVPINISGSLFHKKLGPYWIPIVKLGCSY